MILIRKGWLLYCEQIAEIQNTVYFYVQTQCMYVWRRICDRSSDEEEVCGGAWLD